MKTLAIVTLFAAALISAAGCHWRHRNWRNHRDYSDNVYRSDDDHVRNQQAAVMERQS